MKSPDIKIYSLSNEDIECVSGDIGKFFTDEGIDKKEVLKLRLMAEEALLKYRDSFGENVKIEINFANRLRKSLVQINVYCDRMNPFKDDDTGIMESLTSTTLDNTHVWRFIRGTIAGILGEESRNVITFSAIRPSKLSSPYKILISIITGIVLACISRLLLSADQLTNIADNYVLPVAGVYTGLLCVMAIMMVFFSVPLCMVQYGDSIAFRNDTKKLIRSYITVIVGAVAITLAVSLMKFKLNAGTEGLNGIFKPILDILVGFVPSNILAPFLNFNCMQVMIIGLLFGAAFIVMGDGSRTLVNAFDKCNYAAVIVNGYLTKFVGIYTGLMIYYLVATGDESSLGLVWIILVIAGICIVGMLGMVLLISARFKVKPLTFARKLMPSFMVNMFTGSVGASFTMFFNELTDGCGVDIKYNGVAVNLGIIVFKPVYSAFLVAIGCLLASQTGTLSVVTVAQIVVLAIILPAAIPNIQGGAASIIILFLSSIGIGWYDAAVSLNSLLQFIIIPANIFILQCVIVLNAAGNDKLDIDKLRK